MTTNPEQTTCAHDLVMLVTHCPMCLYEQEEPHTADPVTITTGYLQHVIRCRTCALPRTHTIHQEQT